MLERAKESVTNAFGRGETKVPTSSLPQLLANWVECVNTKNWAGLNLLLAQNVNAYGFNYDGSCVEGSSNVITYFQKKQLAFPDYQLVPLYGSTDANGQFMTARFRWTGTNTGQLPWGAAATNKNVTVYEVIQFKQENNKISEIYGGLSHLSFLNQLGVIDIRPLCTECNTATGTTAVPCAQHTSMPAGTTTAAIPRTY
jgi:hypothetical protein